MFDRLQSVRVSLEARDCTRRRLNDCHIGIPKLPWAHDERAVRVQ
jgi:hypothetical protein